MCIRAIQYQYNCRGFHGYASRISRSLYSRHLRSTLQSFTSNAGRFERQCDITVGLFVRNTDSELPPAVCSGSAYSSNSCMSAFIAISLEVDL